MELKNVTLNHTITKNAKEYPDKIAFEYEDYSYTWMELDKITDHIASKYLGDGITIGTHVGIFSTNSPNWICTYIALAKIGAVSVLINFNYKARELYDIVKYTRLEYLCYGEGYKDGKFADHIDYLRKNRIPKIKQFISIGQNESGQWYQISNVPYVSQLDYEKLQMHKKRVSSSDHLSMILTSGTTAAPKGVLLSHFQMLNIAYEATELMHWGKEDKICLSLSLFHCFGLSTGFLASLVTGCSMCLLPNFRSKQVLEAVEKYKCTILNGVPSMFLAIMKNPDFDRYDLSSLYSGIIAGSGIRRQDYFKVREGFGFSHLEQSYGQTECSPSITFSGYNDSLDIKAVSVGKVIPNVTIRIANPRKNIEVPTGQEGEIQVKGFNVMQHGYFLKKHLSKTAFTKDGWLKTGDIGALDEEGNLFVTGRRKEVIIRCGENISPKEIEESLLDYHGIEDVKVFGIEAPVVQEDVVACYVCNSGFDETDFKDFMKGRMADYKIPKYLIKFENFPLFSNGKLNIKEMKTRVADLLKEEA